jgi:hypothetical protein
VAVLYVLLHLVAFALCFLFLPDNGVHSLGDHTNGGTYSVLMGLEFYFGFRRHFFQVLRGVTIVLRDLAINADL